MFNKRATYVFCAAKKKKKKEGGGGRKGSRGASGKYAPHTKKRMSFSIPSID